MKGVLTVVEATSLPALVDIEQVTRDQAVRCQHPKVMCGPCALALAVRVHAEGVAEERARWHRARSRA